MPGAVITELPSTEILMNEIKDILIRDKKYSTYKITNIKLRSSDFSILLKNNNSSFNLKTYKYQDDLKYIKKPDQQLSRTLFVDILEVLDNYLNDMEKESMKSHNIDEKQIETLVNNINKDYRVDNIKKKDNTVGFSLYDKVHEKYTVDIEISTNEFGDVYLTFKQSLNGEYKITVKYDDMYKKLQDEIKQYI